MNINIQIERWAVDRLIPRVTNPRTHSPEQIAQLAAAIQEWGWTNPILVGAQGDVIAGHARLRAARQLGMTEVPVIVLSHLSESQRRALVIADNQLALNAGWDEELLRLELALLQEGGYDVSLAGLADEELARMLARQDTGEGLSEEDDVPAVPRIPISRRGDLWLLESSSHRLLCGDATVATDVERVLADAQPLLMVTDPPYGVEYDPAWRKRAGINHSSRMGLVTNDHRSDWREAWACFRVMLPMFGTAHCTPLLWPGVSRHAASSYAQRSSGRSRRSLWAVGITTGNTSPAGTRYAGAGHWNGDRKQSTLWEIENRQQDARTDHSTQKPVECMRRPIVNNSAAGEAIYDPFCGSGTTIIACEKEGRVCLAIELNPAYVDMAVTRWQNFTGKRAVLEGDGPPSRQSRKSG